MQDDPNFPIWAQRVVLGIGALILIVAVSAVGGIILGVGSWIASGSH